MKIKVSISMEKELHELVKNKVEGSIFRNTSHLIEHAVETYLKDQKGGKDGF
jgi:metal-responsive CopG/Arc/MetJ family transcriptional regulator